MPLALKFSAALRRGSQAIGHPAECLPARLLHAAPAQLPPNLRATTALLKGFVCHYLSKTWRKFLSLL